ncbi:MAG: hypothetical protein JO323_12600 [Acidobacteriia bacterium]|nr:hypothetical protein [Terriglobia bacterium]
MDPDFLDALIHDLKGPIGRIAMLGDLIRRRAVALDSETQLLLQHVADSAESANNVLEGVRRYAEATQRRFRGERIELSIALDTALKRLNSRLMQSKARVIREPLPEIDGDLDQMTILFEELIANAVRFRSEEAPIIEIKAAAAEPDSWRISIHDNGTGLNGIPEQRLFRPFGKASNRAGAGMGLAICDRIAKAHHGRILAAPCATGAEFHLLVPRLSASE